MGGQLEWSLQQKGSADLFKDPSRDQPAAAGEAEAQRQAVTSGGHTALCCFAAARPPSPGLQGLAEAQSGLPGGRLPAGMKGSPAKPPPQGPPAPSATGSRGGRFDVPALAGEGGPGDSQADLKG